MNNKSIIFQQKCTFYVVFIEMEQVNFFNLLICAQSIKNNINKSKNATKNMSIHPLKNYKQHKRKQNNKKNHLILSKLGLNILLGLLLKVCFSNNFSYFIFFVKSGDTDNLICLFSIHRLIIAKSVLVSSTSFRSYLTTQSKICP